MYVQFEKGVGDLQHEDVRVAVVVDDKNTLDGATHAKVFIVVLEALETCRDGWIFFWLCLLGACGGQQRARGGEQKYLKVKLESG